MVGTILEFSVALVGLRALIYDFVVLYLMRE